MWTPNSLQRSRVAVSSQETIDDYFKLLDSTINKLNLQDKPSQIWNADEAGFGKETDQIKQKIISPTGTKNPYRQQMTDYEHITLLACASAAGGFMPNMLIFTKSLPSGRYASEMPKDWLYATAENGYITRDLFENWFEKVFIPSIGLRRPNLLIIDNHSSHLSIPVIDMAIEHSVEILGLPPHTSHFLQPLDQIFHPLRSGYSELALNIGLVKADMAQDKAWSPHVIKQGFRKTGLYPLDSTAIDKSFIRPNPTTTIQTDDPSVENNETTSNDTCKTCGRTTTNPLVKAGLVDKDLHDILVLGISLSQTKQIKKG
ncbi:tigger transposable element-derived protein 6-like [Mytilus trossulus]|uniref:tigger transposable element-derived protein 6-like n=1 Tax=Mytilus trossulus TaxID=6551 RepID=UPI003004E898